MDVANVGALVIAAFFAGFVDAIAGGGGLVQVPALLSAMPEAATATLFGTNKLSSVFGTASAAWRYLRRVAVLWGFVLPATVAAFCFSFLGAASVAWFPSAIVRPIVFWLLIVVIGYTVWQPGMGVARGEEDGHASVGGGILVGVVIGFYDGFFGPGTGSFLIFVFVRFFGFDFLRASVMAKVVNLGTNVAALVYFGPAGHVLFTLGLVMAAANVLGAQVGARVALRGGSVWVRRVFLGVSGVLVCKVGLSIWG